MQHPPQRQPASAALTTLTTLAAALTALLLLPTPAHAQEEVAKEVLSELPSLNDLLIAAVIFGVALFIARLATGTLDRIGERFATRRLLLKKVASLSRFLVYLGATLLTVLGVFQPEADTLTALITASAVMIGFAFKDLAGSIIAGVIILIDSPFQVGDRVQFGDTYGDVTQIGLRVVQITTLDDNLVSIPNNKFLTEVVASANAGALDMMVQIDFFIGVEEDHLLAKRLAYEAVVTSRFVYLQKPVKVWIEDVAQAETFATRVRAKFYVIDTRFESAVRSDVSERLKLAFAHHHIRSPYTAQLDRLPKTPPHLPSTHLPPPTHAADSPTTQTLHEHLHHEPQTSAADSPRLDPEQALPSATEEK